MLLCSDGLGQSIDVRRIGQDASMPELADRLLADAIERDWTDNVSLVLIDTGPSCRR